MTDNHQESIRLKKLLEEASFIIDVADDFGTASLKGACNYDLLLIDHETRNRDALHICIKLRNAENDVPIIALTSSADISHRVALLNAGADDCIPKPFAGHELIARIRAVMRRGPALKPEVFRACHVVLNSRSQQVFCRKRIVPLSRKEFALLELLFQNQGNLVPRSVIVEQVWNSDTELASNTIGAHFHNIRKKLGRHATELIKNIPGRGYFIE